MTLKYLPVSPVGIDDHLHMWSTVNIKERGVLAPGPVIVRLVDHGMRDIFSIINGALVQLWRNIAWV